MVVVLVLVIIVSFGALAASTPSSQRPSTRLRGRANNRASTESIAELAARDPVDALRRYGTADDAARLSQQGVDLAGLGYDGGEGTS